MVQDEIHKAISVKQNEIRDWFIDQREDLHFPFYSSFDIRDSGYKVVPVDANLFPAGFNNICQTDKDNTVDLVKDYFLKHYPESFKKIVLLTEEHTNNPYYWDNVFTLKTLIESAGKEVRVAIPKELPEPLHLQSANGQMVTVYGAQRKGGSLDIQGFSPDLIISNNDFSFDYQDWADGLDIPMNPPREMGWYQRKKSDFFHVYNNLVEEFCNIIDIDPWLMNVRTEKFEKFDINDESSRGELANHVDLFLGEIQKEYDRRGVKNKPTVFIKNNSGTYGLGVIKADSGDEVRSWSYKSRKKMKAAKGGGGFTEVIIQEGVPTTVQAEGASAEPAIYMLGCQLAGGFLRTHSEKGPDESLNSPGAVYRRLCVSDLSIDVEGNPMENVYGWVGKLGFLSIAIEAKNHGVTLKGYRP
ncbi:MAG: glutamate--cysteine ligase [Bdellovibrionales bacterium]|nr:glutamate--cysteine ligase [Bdellovibrionales bacterium]